MKYLLFLCACLAGLPAAAADAPTPLEAAVQAYDSGRLAQAREAFLRLSREGVAAADYNLAVMHLRGEMPRPRWSRRRTG